jgi:2-methylcitrate dehydratase PrpD
LSRAEGGSVTVAGDLAGFLLGVRYEDLPAETIDNAKKVIVSTLASAAEGSTIRSAQIAREVAQAQGGVPDATAWFSNGLKLPLPNAVRVNAMLSDAAASDDSDLRNIAHIGTILTSMSLAAAERTGASGRDVLAAMVTGYEASGRIGAAISPELGQHGIHACVITVFGGVIAGARLLGLSVEQAAEALSLAATSMGGLAVSTNSWAREYHAGAASLAATHAVLSAAKGYTANPDTFESKRGFLEVFGGKENAVEMLMQGLGDDWDIVTDLTIKIWPGATPLSAAVEAAFNAARQGNVDPEQVASIRVAGPRFRALVGHKHPKDLVGAIHSLAYFIASAVVDREFSWQHATMEKILDPTIDRLQDLVEVEPDSDPSRHTWGWGATVRITMKDGSEYNSTVNAPQGSGPRGIDWADVEHKVRTLTPASGKSTADVEKMLQRCHGFDELKDVGPLIGLL